MNIEISWAGGSGIDAEVQRFWRDSDDLVVRGGVIAAAPADEDLEDPKARVA